MRDESGPLRAFLHPSAFRLYRAAPGAQCGGVLTFVIVWLGIIGVLYWVFFVWYERQENPNPQRVLRQQPAGEVVLQRNRAGHYVADGTINEERVVFLLDTGATHVSLSTSLAHRLGLKLGAPVTLQTAAGPAAGYSTRLASVRLATIEMNDVAALVSDGIEPDMVLLGMNFLKRLEMTQRDDRLVLKQVSGKQ